MRAQLHSLCLILILGGSGTKAAHAGETLLDPTRPPTATVAVQAQAETVAVHVQAIVNRPGSCIAIVNGKLVRAGDRLGSISIKEVTPDGVRYLRDGHVGFARVTSAAPLVVRRALVAKKDLP